MADDRKPEAPGSGFETDEVAERPDSGVEK
jgi:hypothetical protein